MGVISAELAGARYAVGLEHLGWSFGAGRLGGLFYRGTGGCAGFLLVCVSRGIDCPTIVMYLQQKLLTSRELAREGGQKPGLLLRNLY